MPQTTTGPLDRSVAPDNPGGLGDKILCSDAVLEGTVVLRADITSSSGSLLLKESNAVPCALDADTATMTRTASINARKPIKIAYIPTSIDTLSDYFPVTTGDILDVHAKILAQFPFGNVHFRILPAPDRYANVDVDNSDPVSGLYFAYISVVVRRWDLLNNPDNVADYYVTVYGTDKSTYTGSWFFLGEPGGKASCGLRNAGQDCLMSMGNQLRLRPLIFSKESTFPPYNYTFPYTDHRTHIFGNDTSSPQSNAIQTPDVYNWMSPEARDGMLVRNRRCQQILDKWQWTLSPLKSGLFIPVISGHFHPFLTLLSN